MTVFEDLIVELKEENLLEETVISIGSSRSGAAHPPAEEHDFAELIDSDKFHEADETSGFALVNEPEVSEAVQQPAQKTVIRESDIEQVSTFQTVEHVLAGIEKANSRQEQGGFDELRAKKALHALQQASTDRSSDEFAQAATEFRAQVAAWQESLAVRDELIPVATMRCHCETCQPALSAQALFSLARFYRGLPFSENSRGKYEFLVTRLFSRQTEGQKRALICSREEMLAHLRSRFARLMSDFLVVSPDKAELALFVQGFEDFAIEADSAEAFEDLTGSDFFERLFLLKQSASENFFCPEVTAAAISTNISVLNKILDLVETRRAAGEGEDLLRQYASNCDEPMSMAVGRTVRLSAVLVDDEQAEDHDSELTEEEFEIEPGSDRIDRELVERRKSSSPKPKKAAPKEIAKNGFVGSLAGTNKWLLAATVLSVVLSIGLYIWSTYYSETPAQTVGVSTVDLASTDFNDLLQEGRISDDTFYGITKPAWDGLTRENQEAAVNKMYGYFSQKGCKRVSLINSKGNSVAFASESRVNVFRQDE